MFFFVPSFQFLEKTTNYILEHGGLNICHSVLNIMKQETIFVLHPPTSKARSTENNLKN